VILKLDKSKITSSELKITITGSKSESNRLLILQALYPNLKIKNVSNSDDSKILTKALTHKTKLIDIHHAGTAMRFLTAYFSIQNGNEIELTGSSRMKERPIGILVDTLNQLGADINYKEKEGFPPLLIKGKKLTHHKVTLEAHVSSQYISALLLIASTLENGLQLTLKGKITSVPYIKMTLSLLNDIGLKTTFKDQLITVQAKNKNSIGKNTFIVESDWSSASYFYSIVALSDINTEIQLSAYKQTSLQGDSCLSTIYKAFGVETIFKESTIVLKKNSKIAPEAEINLDLTNAPDIAQTITVTAYALGIKCHLSGLHTLKIKETDRLQALKNEIEKLGGKITITSESLVLDNGFPINENITISTYNDHRMAMAFAPLALKVPILIKDAKVVSKSYPSFWEDLKSLGFKIS